MAGDLVEQLARMNSKERNEFIEQLAHKWPHMAGNIADGINLELMIPSKEKYKQKETA